MERSFPAYYCEESFTDVVLPVNNIKLNESREWLTIGSPGVDGIEFRMKANEIQEDTVYAFYPIDNEYVKIADSPEDLVRRWKEGKLIL